MPVRIITDGFPPSSQAPIIFTDDFNRGNGPLLSGSFGQNWMMLITASQSRSNLPPPGSPVCVEQGVQIIANQLALLSTGAPGVIFQVRTWIVPTVWGPLLDGLSQFSEFKIISDSSTGGVNVAFTGPGVLCHQWDPNFNGIGGGYYLEIRGLTGEIVLYRGLGSAGTGTGTAQLIAGGGSMVFAFGDTLRLEVVVNATSNDVTVLRNGVIVGTINDNSALRPMRGLPGIAFCFEGTNTVFQTIDDYSGGPL